MADNRSRREFMGMAAATGLATGLVANSAKANETRNRKALFVWGGWEGHKPKGMRDLFVPILEQEGIEVTVSDTLESYLDEALMNSIDVIVQAWTMGKLSKEQSKGLLKAVKEQGVGLAGWHGGLCDSFRDNTGYQFMTGGQWVAHPGGQIDYEVFITEHEDPITAGLNSFKQHSEQYFLHVDPGIKVLATTTFSGDHAEWIDGLVMPVVWKKVFGKGRVFYSSLGHNVDDYKVPEALEISKRGILWAMESKHQETPHLVSNVYPAR